MSLHNAWVAFEDCTFAAPTVITHGPLWVETGTGDAKRFTPVPGTGGISSFFECTVFDTVAIGDIPFEQTTLIGSHGLDKLRFTSSPKWPTKHLKSAADRDVIADEHSSPPPSPATLEPLYRQLRGVAIEDTKAAPAAADFYYAELDARRRARDVRPVRPVVVPARRWLRRPAAATAERTDRRSGRRGGTVPVEDQVRPHVGRREVDGYHMDQFWNTIAFVARSSVTLFSAPTDSLTAGGTLLLLAERFAAVSLLAICLFALRSKVAR